MYWARQGSSLALEKVFPDAEFWMLVEANIDLKMQLSAFTSGK